VEWNFKLGRVVPCVFVCIFILLIASPVTGQQFLPTISEPVDVTYTEGETGNLIEWWVSYNSSLHYSIHRNGTVLRSEELGGTSGNITVSVDGLSAAVYFFIVIVDDFGDNVETDSVSVNVLPFPTDGIKTLVLVVGVSGAAFVAVFFVLVLLRQRRLED